MEAKRKIEVVPYDEQWPKKYQSEAAGLSRLFGCVVSSIDHIGSTAVPGLYAKPVIDILVVVVAGTDIPSYDKAMEQYGYVCRGEALDAVVPGTPGRFYYVRKQGVNHLVHVHVCEAGHFQIQELIACRDYLRTHPSQAEIYGREKVALSAQFSEDIIGYMRGKDARVKQLISQALAWRASL